MGSIPRHLKLTRRDAIGALAATASGFGGCGWRGPDRTLYAPGRIVGADVSRGHLLRARYEPVAPSATFRYDTVVIGGGISGLAAAAALDESGHHNYLLCELADEPGGNAVAGTNAVSRYPWGAHYVPVLDPTDQPLLALFQRLGIVRDLDDAGLPIYEESVLCADPDERLWIQGQWQEGFLPTVGVGTADRGEMQRFAQLTALWRERRGRDGRRAFGLPLAWSSEDPQIEALDQVAFDVYLDQQGFSSKPLRWYLDYCCRDDFGAPTSGVSAWAGLHYFCARQGRAANAARGDVVTWPEGNAFLARALTASLRGTLRTGWIARRISIERGLVEVDVFDVRSSQTLRIEAAAAVLAVPAHVLAHLVPEKSEVSATAEHTPWVVANVTLSARPEGLGAALAWDNVVYQSPLLGYVVADHQALGAPRDAVVITYYWPLSERPASEARRWAIQRSQADWCADFLAELLRIHPELRGHVEQVDVWIWGHGMIRPSPGYGGEASRRARRRAQPPLFFAHTDLSGMSVFEEAFWLGRAAAADRLSWRRT